MKEKYKKITIADNEEYLRQKSVDVDIKNDEELLEDIEVLDSFCKENSVMAMAAVQLGIPKRIVYLKNTNLDIINKIQKDSATKEEMAYSEAKVLINPIILNSEGLTEYWEACASCLDNCGRVLRPYKIDLEYYDIVGNRHEEVFEGFKATVLSHELDHLDGILHMDIAEEILVQSSEDRKKWRQSHPYIVYSKDKEYSTLKIEHKNNDK